MRRRRLLVPWIAIVLLAVVVAGLPTALAAQPAPFTLRVGYWDGYGMAQDSSGALSGYTYDYMTRIAAYNNWDLTFVACGWAEGQEKLLRGELDVFGPMQKTPAREAQYDYTLLPMGNEYGALYARADDSSIFYDDPDSMNGKTLALVSSNYYIDLFSDYCEKNQIVLTVKPFSDAQAFEQALETGEADLMIAGDMRAPENAKVVLRFPMERFFYPTTKGNQFVLDGMNRAIAELQKGNAYFDAELYDKYYGTRGFGKVALTAQERAFVDRAQTLRVGYQTGRAPAEYQDPETGAAAGISVDLMNIISAYSGLTFEFMLTQDTQDALDLLAQGRLDLLLGVVCDEAFAKAHGLCLTKPLFSSQLTFVLKQGVDFNEQLLSMAIPRNWDGTRRQMEKNYPHETIKTFESTDACLDAVLRGEADIAVQNMLSVDKALKPYRYRALSVNSMRQDDLAVSMATSASAPQCLRAVLNKAIDAIDEKVRDQCIYEYTLGQPYAPSFLDALRYNLPLLIGVVLLAFVLLITISLRSRAKLNRIAFYDPLTGEMNLNKFKLEAQRWLERPDKMGAVIVLDIDKFKSINDLYSYEFGDKILRLVARTLRATLVPGTILAHGVADKFYLMTLNSDSEWITAQFNHFFRQMDAAMKRNIPGCNIVLSAGVCVVLPGDNNVVSLIDRANIASKQIKSYHVSSFSIYDQSMYDDVNRVKTIENEMMGALERGEFVTYLQPKVALSTGKMVGAEALVRWLHPLKGLIPPGEFIPLFEQNGFITQLDYYVLEQVCLLLERWQKQGVPCFPISVNLSRRHLQNSDTAQVVHAITARHHVDPRLIEFELTESAFDNRNLREITALFDQLHAAGFTVSVDDFGSGYSSLSLLKDLPIDVLKIDKSFFDTLERGGAKISILLESVIALSRKLCIKTLSEGVETKEQVDMLIRLGCDLVQGFYFARPMPAAQLEALLRKDAALGADHLKEGDAHVC
ncbi:MAG: EAL domain-containing protein [Clostridia bacterium]